MKKKAYKRLLTELCDVACSCYEKPEMMAKIDKILTSHSINPRPPKEVGTWINWKQHTT